MKKYEVEISELQVWRIFLKVEAQDGEEAKAKAGQGVGELISERLVDVDYKEIIQISELKEG